MTVFYDRRRRVFSKNQGDTISWAGSRKTVSGDAFDLTGYTIRCQVRTNDDASTLVGEIVCDLTNAAAGEYSMLADTTGWALGIHKVNVQYTDGVGFVDSTDNFLLEILAGATV